MSGGTLHFSVTTPGGVMLEADVLEGDTVFQLRKALEEQREVPPAAYLKLIQAAQVLLDNVPVARLDPTQPMFAVIARETSLEILLQAAGTYQGYASLLRDAAPPQAELKSVTLGPFPTILQVLEEMSGEAPKMEHLRPAADDRLEFSGEDGDLLMPSLDLAPLLASLHVEQLQRVTISVGVNSDSFNRGLGVILQASSLFDDAVDESGLPSYVYNGYGLSKDQRGNVVKFHPGMGGGQLRVEGLGGWGNQSMGFTPASWSESGNKLHTLELTVGRDGTNEVIFKGTEEGQVWSKTWTRNLFDGRHLPSLYAWLDMGGEPGKPLVIGRVTLTAHVQ